LISRDIDAGAAAVDAADTMPRFLLICAMLLLRMPLCATYDARYFRLPLALMLLQRHARFLPAYFRRYAIISC